MNLSPLQKARYEYDPKLPGMLRHGISEIAVKKGEATTSAADQEKIALPEKWNVQFADSFSWPKFTEKVPVEELCCVQEIAGWEKKAGTLQFSSELKLEYEISAVLDLGEVFETAEVKVNGISAGLRLCRPYRFDLTGLLKKGENQITIEVTNCLGTALRDPISHYLMIEPFGIEGPVVMKKIQK